MKREAMELHLNYVINGLEGADIKDERREYMNALLRVVAMICFESSEPTRSMERAFNIIRVTMEEPEEVLH